MAVFVREYQSADMESARRHEDICPYYREL